MTARRQNKNADAFDAWVDAARAVSVQGYMLTKGLWQRSMLGDAGNPCPGCGGADRFSVNLRKNVWCCRAGGAGGDAIALARHLYGFDFLAAVEEVAGEPRPDREARETAEERALREQRLQARLADAEAQRDMQTRENEKFRAWARADARKLWAQSRPIGGTVAQEYLCVRGLVAPREAMLRFVDRLPYWDRPGGAIIHRGPAMIAAIHGPDGTGRQSLIGVHRTWIDLRKPKGKAEIVHPQTGEFLPAKKVLGSKKGGTVLLGSPSGGEARRLVMGEGIETVLAVQNAMLADDAPGLATTEFRSAVDLGNLGGRAAGKVRHPTETRAGPGGGVQPVLIDNDVPRADDPLMMPYPHGVEMLMLLGDGDSEPVRTALAMARAQTRFAAAWHIPAEILMAPGGSDFARELALMAGRAA